MISSNCYEATITTTVKYIFNAISECRDLRWVGIWTCTLQDEDLREEIIECPKFEELMIVGCNVSKHSFYHLCKLSINVREVYLSDIKGMKGEWWSTMVETIVRAKENNDGYLTLRELKITGCPLMNDEMKNKVITFILIHNYPNFIIIRKWFNI